MLGATTCTVLLGFSFFFQIHSLWYFIIVQIFGGIFQASGWPAIVGILGNWVPKSSRGLLTGVWNWHTSGGNLLGYLIPAIWAKPDSWGWSFLSAAFIMLSICVLVFLFLPTDPEVVGLHGVRPKISVKYEKKYEREEPQTHSHARMPSKDAGVIDEAQQLVPSEEPVDDGTTVDEETTDHNSDKKKAISIWKALAIPGVVEYSFALFFSKLVSYTFLFWLPFYISNERIGGKCFNSLESALFAIPFDVGAMIGSVVIGVVSDVIHSRSLSCMLFLALAVPSLFVYRAFGYISVPGSGILIAFVGIFVNGPYALITTAVSADLGNHKKLKGEKRAMATVTAIVDATGSIGAALGPFLAGWIEDQFGWDEVFYLLMVCCFLAGLLIIRLVILDIKKGIQSLKRKWAEHQGKSYGVLPDDTEEQERSRESLTTGPSGHRRSLDSSIALEADRNADIKDKRNLQRSSQRRMTVCSEVSRHKDEVFSDIQDRRFLRRASDSVIPIRRVSIQGMPNPHHRPRGASLSQDEQPSPVNTDNNAPLSPSVSSQGKRLLSLDKRRERRRSSVSHRPMLHSSEIVESPEESTQQELQ
jgi:OPA family glycerol-3-phosphate transporter-like MFS transporter 1/2